MVRDLHGDRLFELMLTKMRIKFATRMTICDMHFELTAL